MEVIIILHSSPVSGQMIWSDYDSIAVIKPEINNPVYEFFYKGSWQIQHELNNATLVHYQTNPILRDIGNGALTAITGIGFTTTTDGNWKVESAVSCNDLRPDWIVNLFCEGSFEKNRERVTNEDGSRSVETEEIAIFYWERNANGILIERGDTIGFFSIIMNPCENEILESWCSDIFPVNQERKNNKSGLKLDVFWKPGPGNDYGIAGKLRGRDFKMLRNGIDRKIRIIMNDTHECLFQADLNYPGISKKYRIQPYFLFDPDISDQDRSDMFRLAMVGKILNNAIDSN